MPPIVVKFTSGKKSALLSLEINSSEWNIIHDRCVDNFDGNGYRFSWFLLFGFDIISNELGLGLISGS